MIDTRTQSRGARELRDQAQDSADRLSSTMGRQAGTFARAIRAASDQLRADGEAGMADLTERAAEQVERMGGYLDDENPGEMLRDLETVGRENPATFLSSAFAVGLMGGRFVRASGSARGDGRPADAGDAGAAAGTAATSSRIGSQPSPSEAGDSIRTPSGSTEPPRREPPRRGTRVDTKGESKPPETDMDSEEVAR